MIKRNVSLGSAEANKGRVLGRWLADTEDVKSRKLRAGKLWGRIRPQLVKSKLSKRQQAVIVECCVEAGLLFDASTWPWKISELKSMQSWIDKIYRYTWNNKKEAPLRVMQRTHTNMQDIRNSLEIKSLRLKVETRTLQRIGHVCRMENSRLTKAAAFGWLEQLETIPKNKSRTIKTQHYWRKLIREAGVDLPDLPAKTIRKTWKKLTRERTNQLWKYEQSLGNKQERDGEGRDQRNAQIEKRTLTCHICQKTCKSAGGLGIHLKRIHKTSNKSFKCHFCEREFKTEASQKNHLKSCRTKYLKCPSCGLLRAATNKSRHLKSCLRREGVPPDRR